ncbi:hypothetical protein SAMN04490196_1386 [Pseudomonas moraviensis]|nr:hypothetical protein SAMN04490196_1386 [Pseudomonas moraviensis]
MPSYKFKVISASIAELKERLHIIHFLARLVPAKPGNDKPYIYMFRFGYDYTPGSGQVDVFGGNLWVFHQILAQSDKFDDSINIVLKKSIEEFHSAEYDNAYHMYNYYPGIIDGTHIDIIEIKKNLPQKIVTNSCGQKGFTPSNFESQQATYESARSNTPLLRSWFQHSVISSPHQSLLAYGCFLGKS